MTDKGKQPSFVLNWKKIINNLVLIVGIGLILNLFITYFISGDFQIQKLLSFSKSHLFLAFVLAIFPWIGHALEIIIWSAFFKRQLNFKDALRISIATDLGSAITPTMVGGAPIKIGLLMRKGLSSGQAAAMVTFTGIEDLVFFLVVIPLSIIFSDQINSDILFDLGNKLGNELPSIFISLAIVALVTIVLYYVSSKFNLVAKVRQALRSSLSDFKSAMALIAKNGWKHFILATLAIGTRWVSRFFILIVLVKGLGLDIASVELFFNEWLVYMGMTITPTPGAIGGAEGGFYLVYKSIIPALEIGTIIFAWRFFNYYLLLILSAIYLNVSREK